MPRQNTVRRDAALERTAPAAAPFRGILLRFVGSLVAGLTAGVPNARPVNGAAVTNWVPTVGSGDLTQSDPSLKPTYSIGGVGGNVYQLVFAAGHRLAQAAIGALPVGASPRTLVFFGQDMTSGGVTDGQPLLRYGTLATANRDFGVGIDEDDFFVARTATAQQLETTPGVSPAGINVIVVTYDGTTLKILVGGSGETYSGSTARTLNTVAASNLTLGDAATLAFKAEEIIFYDHALTRSELLDLAAYLYAAYHVTFRVPA